MAEANNINKVNKNATMACPNDCKRCSFQQHAYCAAQLSYRNMMMLKELTSRVDMLEHSQAMTKQSVYADPFGEQEPTEEDIAQNEDGAEE